MSKDKTPKTNAMRGFDLACIPYRTLSYHCDGENFDGELVAAQVGLPAGQVFKTLVTRDEIGRIAVCCIPVDARLNLKTLASAARCKRLEMIRPQELLALTGYVRGGCSPAGMKKTYPTFIDASACRWEEIAVSAGQRGLQLLLAPADLIRHTAAVTGGFVQASDSPLQL